MQIVKYKYDKYTTVSIYSNYKGSLTIIGAKCKYTSQSLEIYKELLLLSNTSIIIRVFKNKGGIHLKNILLESLHYYNRHCKDKTTINDNLISNTHYNSIQQSNLRTKAANGFTLLVIIGGLIIISIFIYDCNSSKLKINQGNINKANELKAEYLNNNCIKKAHLPALREFCQKIARDIDSLKTQNPTMVSVFFMWILDIFNNGYSLIGITNVIVTILIILLVRKLI